MSTRQALSINFDDKDVIRDPFPVYEEIRAKGRVVFNELLGIWMAVGFEDVSDALHDPARFSNESYGGATGGLDVMGGARTMISTDPPEQIPLRKVAQQAFLRSSLAKLETTITDVVDELLDAPDLKDRFAAGQEIEMMDAFCRQVPARVIALLLGVPLTDLQMFIDWSDDLSAVMDTGQSGTPEYEQTVARAGAAGTAMRDYLQEQIDLHRRTEHDDLINDLLVANENGILDDAELLATLILLLIAGNETTSKLIGAGLRLLADNPDQRTAIVDNRALLIGAVEEFLRFEGVTTLVPRIVKQDTTLGDAELSAGEWIILLLGAANRDPQEFTDPNRFDITRNPNHHLAFGHGVHHCLGNRLARMETQLALTGFLDRFPGYEVGEFSYKPVFLARGLDSLHIGVA
ncbi:MAG: cytochrome P450 [Acidimicrobiia bacterium]|nr:cytochrome P450 [Acidimicrobiia bacterium]